jgi:hypothetical protein
MAKKKEIIIKKEKITPLDVQEKEKIEKVLVENFVSLQKVMTNLAVKFDSLSNQISKLLELFEISAKTIAEKGISAEGERTDKKVVEKLDNLLEQNKVIAKGIALLHERESSEPEQGYNSLAAQNPQRYVQPSPSQQIARRVADIQNPESSQANFSKNPRFRNAGM